MKDTKTIFEKNIETIFNNKNEEKMNILLELTSLFLYENLDTNFSTLFDVIGLENFVKLLLVMENKKVEFPSLNDFKKNVDLATAYYYKEVEGEEINSIKDEFGIDLKKSSINSKIKKLNKKLNKSLYDEIMNYDR